MSASERVTPEASGVVRVLLIGGRPEQVGAIEQMLAASQSRVFQLTCCARLAQAVDHPDAKSAELVLLDLGRGGAGLDTLTQTRLRLPRVPTVVVGDEDDERFATRALQTGARAYLHRSELSTRLLVTTLRAALESHRTILQLNTARERARHLASHDQLTGLPNRTQFGDKLAKAIAVARRGRQKLAVLYLDLDGFKVVNDSLGHAVGDGLLRGIARQIDGCLRETDVAARLGGDEFAVLLTHLEDEGEAARIADAILAAVDTPINLRRSFTTTASIGIASFPRDGVEAEELVKKADIAMYHAKQRGRNRCEFFNREMNASVQRRAQLEAALRSALGNDGMRLHFQPQYDVRRERIVGSEALVRWQHPEFGMLGPGEFLPLAEESGLILELGEWVLRNACHQNSVWQARGHPGLKVAVNVASQQFQEPAFAEVVASALEDSGLRPESLELEITESSLLSDVEATLNTLFELKRLGIRLGIDDFGTGYSALSYLKRLPIDVLKIDQSFVQGIDTDPADATITQTIVQMAKGLQLTTVAEGVESREQLLLLGSYGCSRMQGYFFGHPVAAGEFQRWLDDPPFQWRRGG